MNPYLDPNYVRAALRALELRPTRGMGQNFLVDQEALNQIVDAADLAPNDVVVEVGPGLGALTWELVQRVRHVTAVELDKRLAAWLRKQIPTNALTIIQRDILTLPPSEIATELPARSYKVVANLPYAITAPVLRHFIESSAPPTVLVVLVQWEVAQRVTAQPGALSMLAHAVQFYAQPEIVARIAPQSFQPAPAVDSAVLRLHIRPTPAIVTDDVDGLFCVIKAGFLQPRKKLSNALANGLAALGRPIPRETVLAALTTADIDPGRRAETLSIDEWAAVWRTLGSATLPIT